MPGDPRLRASDADRERTAQLLREHHAVGRLTVEEFNDRLERAFAARTLGELDQLLADLPAIDLYKLPSAGIRPTRRGGSGPRLRPDGSLVPSLENGWGGLAAASGLLLAVWLVVGIAVGGLAWIPWFVLILGPWALGLATWWRRPLPRPRAQGRHGSPPSGTLWRYALTLYRAPRLPPTRSPWNRPRGDGVM